MRNKLNKGIICLHVKSGCVVLNKYCSCPRIMGRRKWSTLASIDNLRKSKDENPAKRQNVMVRARSHSFQRIMKGRLQRSLRWWPPHHCSVPPLPPATLIRLISELRRNTPLLRYHQQNLHSYHCHYQPAPCAIYRSTTGAPPYSTHVPCSRPIISRTHQFSRSWVMVTTRTSEDLCWHPLAPSGVRVSSLYVHSTTICYSS